MQLGDDHKIDVETFSSGSLGLDIALGGGIPKGRIIEVYGPESSGKTTFNSSTLLLKFKNKVETASLLTLSMLLTQLMRLELVLMYLIC